MDWRFAAVAPNAKPKWTGSWVGPDDEEETMPLARILILVPEEDGWGLYRYGPNGEFAGDTWHESEQEALEQAEWAYGKALGEWQAIPRPKGKLGSVAKSLLRNLK